MSDNRRRFRRGAVFFDDGDIILSVQDEENCQVLYRVDTKFLARHSPVFSGMFSLPPAPGVNEELDGVPIVHLTDDQKALEDLLQFIYNPLYVFADCRSSCALTSPRGAHACRSLGLKRRSSDTAVRCMGLLELGKKYEVDSVKATVAEHLKNDCLQRWRNGGASRPRSRGSRRCTVTPATRLMASMDPTSPICSPSRSASSCSV